MIKNASQKMLTLLLLLACTVVLCVSGNLHAQGVRHIEIRNDTPFDADITFHYAAKYISHNLLAKKQLLHAYGVLSDLFFVDLVDDALCKITVEMAAEKPNKVSMEFDVGDDYYTCYPVTGAFSVDCMAYGIGQTSVSFLIEDDHTRDQDDAAAAQ